MKSISQTYLAMRNRGKAVSIVEDREPSIGGTNVGNMGQPRPRNPEDEWVPIQPKRRG